MLPSLTALLSIRKLEIVNIRDGATEKREDLQWFVSVLLLFLVVSGWSPDHLQNVSSVSDLSFLCYGKPNG